MVELISIVWSLNLQFQVEFYLDVWESTQTIIKKTHFFAKPSFFSRNFLFDWSKRSQWYWNLIVSINKTSFSDRSHFTCLGAQQPASLDCNHSWFNSGIRFYSHQLQWCWEMCFLVSFCLIVLTLQTTFSYIIIHGKFVSFV